MFPSCPYPSAHSEFKERREASLPSSSTNRGPLNKVIHSFTHSEKLTVSLLHSNSVAVTFPWNVCHPNSPPNVGLKNENAQP